MDFTDIERILALVREHDLAEFELERDGLKVRVRKAGAPMFHAAPMPVAAAPVMPAALPPASLPASGPVAAAAAARAAADAEELGLAVGESPTAATFCAPPAP